MPNESGYVNREEYMDSYCRLCKDGLFINSYYLPLCCTKRHIPIQKIERVWYAPKNESFGSSWGITTYNCIWWSKGFCRECNCADDCTEYNVVIDVDEETMKGFSVANIKAFLAVLYELTEPFVMIMPEIPF